MKLTVTITETSQPLFTLELHDGPRSVILAEGKCVDFKHSRAELDGQPIGIYAKTYPGERTLTIDVSDFQLLDAALVNAGLSKPASQAV